ncbi:MAG: TetR/AcrR family transcriptional regulator [Planctomycetaceae bacterium]|nr:MAG: TetR/AcrR family transcriptional regulator [Planctomycetaceae bacterium]
MLDEELTPKAAKKRQIILRHALSVFAKEGFGDTDVQIIADLAGVGKGTIYRHFGNKKQLFLATAQHCLQQLADFIRQQVGKSKNTTDLIQEMGTIELVRQIARAYAQFYERHPEAVEIMIQERAAFRDALVPSHLLHRAERRAEFDRLLSEAMDRGEFRRVDVTHATNAFADLVYGSVVNGCLEGGRGQLVERVQQAVEIFLNGLVAPEELSRKK